MVELDPMPEPGSEEWERWRKRHPPPPPPTVYLKVWLFCFGLLAAGYAVFRMLVAFIAWVTSHNQLYGLAGVLGLFCVGPCFAWIHARHRRIFGVFELILSATSAFYFVHKLTSMPFELGVILSLGGVIFLFVKGFNDIRHNSAA
jgi:hypothetical protein